ncbi:MAG: 2TM domain-containing protein [Cyanobacteria bacterium J06638_28]
MTELTTESVSAKESPGTYQTEDAQAILQLAIARHTEEGEMTRPQLLEIALELGISEQVIAEAEQEWQLQRVEQKDLADFDQFCRDRFQSHALRFAIGNAVLMTLNVMTAKTLSWSPYILLVWSAVLGLQAWHTYNPNDQRYRQAFEKWRRRQQLKRSFNRFLDWLLGTR